MTDHSAAAGALIVLGAPSHEMLRVRMERFGALPNRVVVVDPFADSILPGQQGVERIATAVSDADGEAEISTYSVAGLRSFTPAAPALTALFPRLRVLEKLKVQAISVNSLLARLGALPEPLILWIDMAGQEIRLLHDLQKAGILERAENLLVRCGVERFFEGADDSDAVRGWLEGAGFDMVERDEADPDWPDMAFRRNALAHQLREMKSRVAAQDLELAELRKVVEAAKDEKAGILAEAADLRSQLQSQKDAFKEQVSKLEADLQAVLKNEEGVTLTEEVVQLREELSELEAKLKAAEDKAEAARADLGLQMRLKEMQKLDLDNLRERYEESEDRRRQQEELFLKLTPRLSQASEQLRQLQIASETSYTLPEEEAGNAPKPKTASVKQSRGKSSSKRSKKV